MELPLHRAAATAPEELQPRNRTLYVTDNFLPGL
jgi:hypothetical protein